jgi:hypothetical protein
LPHALPAHGQLFAHFGERALLATAIKPESQA